MQGDFMGKIGKCMTRVNGRLYRCFFLDDNQTLFVDKKDKKRFITVSSSLKVSKLPSILFFKKL